MRRDDIDSWDASGSDGDGDGLIFLDETLQTVDDADAVQPIGFSPRGSSDGQDGGELYTRWLRMADEAMENRRGNGEIAGRTHKRYQSTVPTMCRLCADNDYIHEELCAW